MCPECCSRYSSPFVFRCIQVLNLKLWCLQLSPKTPRHTEIAIHYITRLRYVTLHHITSHDMTWYYITLHYITLHYITLHYITLHYITLHYITLHYITLHYITLHYITLHRIERQDMTWYIPVISGMRGPYGKLWTEFFPSFYGPSAKRLGHENQEGKNEGP